MESVFWAYLQDGGDGSARALFFRTKREAEQYADADFEEHGQRLCDDIQMVRLRFDAFGALLNPTRGHCSCG